MRPPISILAALIILSTFAVAQSLDIEDESAPLSETDEGVSGSPPSLDDLQDQVGSEDPVLVEPKFDMTAEQPDDFGDTRNLTHTDPEPAPGFVIKIPTN